MGGTVIDAQKNIYLTANFNVMKFSPDGRVLWVYDFKRHCGPKEMALFTMNAPSLWGDAVFGNTESGQVFAIRADTGDEIWTKQILWHWIGPEATNNGFVQASDGVVVVDTLLTVHALDAKNGDKLWEFSPDKPVWNFLASFPGDGTVVFQDWEGRVYRLRLSDGGLIWKAGGLPGTWTDGSLIVGSNGLVYAVNCFGFMGIKKADFPGSMGAVTAYSLSDGRLVWRTEVPMAPNNMPAVGRLGEGPKLSVVQPIGNQAVKGETFSVLALDAETGEQQWIFRGPTQVGWIQAAADLTESQSAQIQANCVPNPWSAPTIDALGTVYIASQEGPIFSLRDANGDGEVAGAGEVDSYQTWRATCGSEAPSLAPGLMAVATCDLLTVFRWPAESA
eukprot:CAMPEP_0204587044 /NCGR_PEP_ID=MMETSP0661-20131031/47834_1 /ASSEMBLY_ACC=CAM_ASM_000606 /TAXON_ID=109239 /ORGANISM="Alexandrium margalefi, Strain AMGDE01CS-322" /LENGTH=390 /DNA_ID=CAMNT_0051596729 /DNA_START=1 /DNA_END=1170 /DNA_ORIENTATION=+